MWPQKPQSFSDNPIIQFQCLTVLTLIASQPEQQLLIPSRHCNANANTNILQLLSHKNRFFFLRFSPLFTHNRSLTFFCAIFMRIYKTRKICFVGVQSKQAQLSLAVERAGRHKLQLNKLKSTFSSELFLNFFFLIFRLC